MKGQGLYKVESQSAPRGSVRMDKIDFSTEIYILFARTLQIEAGLLQFYSCNVKHMGTSELESTTSVPIRDLYSTV